MRIATSLSAGIVLAALALGVPSASAAPAMPSSDAVAGSTVEQVRMHRRHRHAYRAPQRVMGLVPGPSRRGRRMRTHRR